MNYTQYSAAELVGLAITYDVDTLIYEMSSRLQEYVDSEPNGVEVDRLETEIRELAGEFAEVEDYCSDLELENRQLKKRLAERGVVVF